MIRCAIIEPSTSSGWLVTIVSVDRFEGPMIFVEQHQERAATHQLAERAASMYLADDSFAVIISRRPRKRVGMTWDLHCIGQHGCGLGDSHLLGRGQTTKLMAIERALLHAEDAHSSSLIPVDAE